MDLGPFELNSVICGDCLPLMRQTPRDVVDLTVTSPPFNVGKDYGPKVIDRRPWAEYYSWLAIFVHEIWRVTMPGGILALNVPPTVRTKEQQEAGGHRNEYVYVAAVQLVQGAGWRLREPLVWVKGPEGEAMANNTAIGSDNNPYLRGCHEMVILASKEHYYFRGGTGRRGQNPLDLCKDVWHIRGRSHPAHPAVFPKELAARLIELLSPADGLIFDPCCGTGTTLAAARDAGRPFIGCDINPLFCDIARAEAQPRLL